MKLIKIGLFRGLLVMLLLGLVVLSAPAQIATGGAYTLNRSVVAGGGDEGSDPINNSYRLIGTAGQSAAGRGYSSVNYNLISGFWFLLRTPTVASANIIGRVLRDDGLGIRNVIVTLSGGTLATPRLALTGGFGYFTFDELEVGQTYVITVAKSFLHRNIILYSRMIMEMRIKIKG